MPARFANMRQALVLIHDYGDTLGTLTDGLLAEQFVCKYWNPMVQCDPPVASAALDLLIVLGGAAHPWAPDHRDWQRREIRFIDRAIAAGVPTLGICLGAQLIALSFGASVKALEAPKIGPLQLVPTGPDTLLTGFRESRFRVLKWHEYGFDCPRGASSLAVSPNGTCEAFSYRDKVLATQFHLEATRDVFQGWMLENLHSLGSDTPALRHGVKTFGPAIEDAARSVFETWLAGHGRRSSSEKEARYETADR